MIWYGSAGICINEQKKMLMVFQGNSEEKKSWSVPSGALQLNETLEECCVREIREETGYLTEVVSEIMVKKRAEGNIVVEVHYYYVKLVGGEMNIQDPDQLIYDISWKSAEEIQVLDLSYPEDKELLIHLLETNILIK